VPTGHDCGNLSFLAERTRIGLFKGHPELLDGVVRLAAPESVIGFFGGFFFGAACYFCVIDIS